MKFNLFLITILSLSTISCDYVNGFVKSGGDDSEVVLDTLEIISETNDNFVAIRQTKKVKPEVVVTPQLETKTETTPVKSGSDFRSKTNEDVVEFSDLDEVPTLTICSDYNSKRRRTNCVIDTLSELITSNFVLEDSIANEIRKGDVVLEFVVEVDGKISSVELVSDFGHGSGEHALKVVKSLNRKGFEWVPGMIGEEMVRSYFELPVRFKF